MNYIDNEFNLEEELREVKSRREQKEKEKLEEIEKELENETFIGRIKNTYKEVKEEERKNNFSIRHNRLRKAGYEYYGQNSKNLSLQIGKVHILGETFYQLDKLKIKKHDTSEKYIIRNRGLALILAGTIALTGINAINKTKKYENTPLAPIEEVDNSIILTRYYTVEFGDTLSEISADTGISVKTIQNDNGIKDSNIIYMNEHLLLNYSINLEDLEYYTQSTPVNGKSIYEIADSYNTDITSIIKLNEGVIRVAEDGTYIIVSDTLLVPNFITRSELAALKSYKK